MHVAWWRLQVRQAERRMRAAQDFGLLKSKYEQAQAELSRVKAAAKQKEDYFNNFTTQLFRQVKICCGLHGMKCARLEVCVKRWARGAVLALQKNVSLSRDSLHDFRLHDVGCASSVRSCMYCLRVSLDLC